MRPFRPSPWWGLMLALVMPGGVAADAATDLLVSQARYWEQKGRMDLARESWQKLLRLDPNHPELRKLASSPGAAAAAGVPSVAAAAASLNNAQGGAAAVPAQQKASLSGLRPEAELGVSDQSPAPAVNWDQTRRDLERRVRTDPGQIEDRIALARHLTLRRDTRWSGLDQLIELADDPAAAAEVQAIWRQTLLWMSGRGAGARYFEAYLKRYGDDATLRAKLMASDTSADAMPEASPAGSATRGSALRRAWTLIDAGDLDGAEEIFAGVRARDPRDAEAAGGLGSLRLRQERYSEARELLEEAARVAPERWRAVLARAWIGEALLQAQEETSSGRPGEAERQLRELIGRSPQIAGKDLRVKVALADVLAAQHKSEEAEKIYRDVLRKDRDHEAASRGLISLLSNTDRVSDAMAFYRTLGIEQQARIGGLPSLQALALRQQAARARAAKDPVRAESLLREALVVDPLSILPRLDLARLYLSQNRRREARSLIEGLPQEGPQRGEAYYTRALIAADEQNWFDGLVWMEQVPAAQRNAEMTAEQQRLWVMYQAERAAVHARQGQRAKALSLLGEIEAYARTPEGLGRVAAAYAEAGDAPRALHLLRQEIARKPDPAVDLQLRYAELLLALDQQVEFEAQIDKLARRSTLTPPQQSTLAGLRVAERLQQADRLRASGDPVAAREVLEAALREHADHPSLTAAIAGTYEDSRDPERAIALYRQALERDPALLAAYEGLVRVHLASGRKDEAERWVTEALRIDPDNAELHELAAQVATARGQHSRAKQLSRRALELRPDPAGGASTQSALRLQLLDPQLRPLGNPGEAGAKAGDVDQVRFERQLRSNPFDPAALNNLAALAAAQPGRQEEARDLLERAQRLAPDSAEIRSNLERLAQAQRVEPAPSSSGHSLSKLPPEPPRLWIASPPAS